MMPAGIDEAGRGAWAGPICAVIIGFLGKLSTFGVQIRDSKLLSEKQREIAAEVIQKEALCGIGIVSHTFIDTYGIQEANRECFRAALRDLTSRTGVGSGLHIKIDGREICSMPYSYEYIVDGDALDEHIAAASIVAKVTRDRLMREFDKVFISKK
jgi:ribonuclease HII